MPCLCRLFFFIVSNHKLADILHYPRCLPSRWMTEQPQCASKKCSGCPMQSHMSCQLLLDEWKQKSIVLFFIAFRKLLSCSPYFFNVQGPFYFCYIIYQKPGREAPGAFKDFFPKEETVASRTMLCLQRGWCALGVWAFGLGIFDMFCHYMLSSGGLAGRFCPMVQLASATHMAAGGNLSRFRFGRLCICSFQPRSKVPPQDRRFWAPKRGSKSKASNQAAFIGLPCAVPARAR